MPCSVKMRKKLADMQYTTHVGRANFALPTCVGAFASNSAPGPRLVVLLFIELGRLAHTRPRGASGRYRLWDIDLIIQRTLVCRMLSACAISLFVLIIGYIGALAHIRSNYCFRGSYGYLRKESLPYPSISRLCKWRMNGEMGHHSFLCNESGNEVNENHPHYRVELDKGNANE